ncbi:hypothetical protein SAMN05216532_0079 [Streptomyces sp. 2231.1]|uniref:hypothetical protein n=1 Tax=Streptomyces sp. 2231.1 TaxID=1855347 RepID=UPI0008953CCA|nr:hypothetical protein [Streptomyces sp. 2231.1]SEB97702.1 hypothetical protein SAMN05216532_0079 [Streptomyces sp. 2231.1]
MEPEAKDVSRSDLVGHWHAGESCDSSLVLEEGGSARWKHWATGYSVRDARITGRQDGQGSWTLETVKGKQYFEVKRGNTFEPMTVLQGDGRLILLQIPGEDPDNSIGCRFEQVDNQKPN